MRRPLVAPLAFALALGLPTLLPTATYAARDAQSPRAKVPLPQLAQLSVENAEETEGDDGNGEAVFVLKLKAPSSSAITVGYSTRNGTAKASSDYSSASGTVTFEPGQTTKTVTVPVLDDLLDEAAETFSLNIAPTAGVLALKPSGIARILDNDAPPVLSVSEPVLTGSSAGMSSLSFEVRLSAPSGRPVAVGYTVNRGDGTAGSSARDLLSRLNTVQFSPGQTVKTVNLPIVGAPASALTECSVHLSRPINATLAPESSATCVR